MFHMLKNRDVVLKLSRPCSVIKQGDLQITMLETSKATRKM